MQSLWQSLSELSSSELLATVQMASGQQMQQLGSLVDAVQGEERRREQREQHRGEHAHRSSHRPGARRTDRRRTNQPRSEVLLPLRSAAMAAIATAKPALATTAIVSAIPANSVMVAATPVSEGQSPGYGEASSSSRGYDLDVPQQQQREAGDGGYSDDEDDEDDEDDNERTVHPFAQAILSPVSRESSGSRRRSSGRERRTKPTPPSIAAAVNPLHPKRMNLLTCLSDESVGAPLPGGSSPSWGEAAEPRFKPSLMMEKRPSIDEQLMTAAASTGQTGATAE